MRSPFKVALPIFISTIKYNTNPTDVQKHETFYEITLVYDGYSATAPVYFEPQDQTISLPLLINGKANYKSGYYNLYNYEFFFTIVNEAIRTTFINHWVKFNSVVPKLPRIRDCRSTH